MKTLALILLISCNYVFGQDTILPFPVVDKLMKRDFPTNSMEDGRWVYFSNTAGIKQIDKPIVQQVIPKYAFYEMQLTNFLGYHINKSNCLVLIDTIKSKTFLVVPMWYSGASKDFLKLFIGKQFADSTTLMQFTIALQELMLTGSSGELEAPVYALDKITFDHTYEYGSHNKQVWRHIEIILVENKIKRFTFTNPATNETITVR